jgi:poly-gamma-glutamate biosynthesis protein PgsC/CapC
MVIEVLFIGILLGYLYYEVTGISPGGVIAPGYFALFIKQPDKMGMTIILSLFVWAALQFLSRHFILYGRRKLLMAILMDSAGCRFSSRSSVDRVYYPGIDCQ